MTSIVKYRESHYVTVLDMYDTIKPDIFFFISPDFVLRCFTNKADNLSV